MTQSHALESRPGARGGGRRTRFGAWLAAVALVGCLGAPGVPPALSATDVFIVQGVDVDVTADTAAQARDRALVQGQAVALRRLFSRLALAAHGDRLPEVAPERVTNLVRDFEVANEKTSTTRYLATLRVRFKPDPIRNLLREHEVGFAETPSKPLLVLPVYGVARALALWDEPNPWREAWLMLRVADGLVPLVHPLGDLQDIASIGPEQAVDGNRERLKAIAARYGASDVLIMRAEPRTPEAPSGIDAPEPWLQVTISRLGTASPEQTRVESFRRQGEADDLEFLMNVASRIVTEIEEQWKRDNLLRFDTSGEISVVIPISSLAQWLTVKQRLREVPFIRRSDLLYLSRQRAAVRLNFIGDREQLRLALLQKDLILERGPTSWTMHLDSGWPAEGPEPNGASSIGRDKPSIP